MSDNIQGVDIVRAKLALKALKEILRPFGSVERGRANIETRDDKGEESQNWVVVFTRPSRPDFDEKIPKQVFNVPVIKNYDPP